MISKSIEYKVDKFIFSSTAAVYGSPNYLPIDEKHKTNPINHYGFTKLYIEKYLDWISNFNKMKFISFRFFNAAGYNGKIISRTEYNPQNLLPLLMEVATGKKGKINIFGNDYNTIDGTCIRDYIHVLDIAHAHFKAINYLENNKDSQIINLSSEKGYSILEVIKVVENVVGNKIVHSFQQRRQGDPPELVASSKKANQILNWKAEFSDIENIIQTSWDLYKRKMPKV